MIHHFLHNSPTYLGIKILFLSSVNDCAWFHNKAWAGILKLPLIITPNTQY